MGSICVVDHLHPPVLMQPNSVYHQLISSTQRLCFLKMGQKHVQCSSFARPTSFSLPWTSFSVPKLCNWVLCLAVELFYSVLSIWSLNLLFSLIRHFYELLANFNLCLLLFEDFSYIFIFIILCVHLLIFY